MPTHLPGAGVLLWQQAPMCWDISPFLWLKLFCCVLTGPRESKQEETQVSLVFRAFSQKWEETRGLQLWFKKESWKKNQMNVLTTRLSPLYLLCFLPDYSVVQRPSCKPGMATIQLFTPTKLFCSLVNRGNRYRFRSPQDEEGIEPMLHNSLLNSKINRIVLYVI